MTLLATWFDGKANCPACGEWRTFSNMEREAAKASLRPFLDDVRKQIRSQVDSDEEAERVMERLKYTVACHERELVAGVVITIPRTHYWSKPKKLEPIRIELG